jgi:hypothetical protein
VTRAALHVAHAIERQQHFFAKLGGFTQYGFHHIGRRIGKAGKVVVAFDMEDVVQQKEHVFHGGLVGRHGRLRASVICSLSIAGARSLPRRTASGSRIQITLTLNPRRAPGATPSN